ncbi:MAG: exodeoxyribonuclease VII small subunit [Muribaculaceae bacterium]|nr:exodeoxyribonuclease VII small subunit [Muribaculaceae bacterium]
MEKEITELTYNEALEQLEQILSTLRSDSCDVDTLADRTRRASQLLTECRKRLTRTEEELAQVLEELDNNIVQ